jgi:hypothetical protein
VVVVVALLWFRSAGDNGEPPPITEPSGARPDQVVAVADDGRLLLLAAEDGRVLRVLVEELDIDYRGGSAWP